MNEGSFRERILLKDGESKIMSAEEAAGLIEKDMTIGVSGFTPSGYPKAVPLALAARAEKEGPIPITVWSGASTGEELDGALSRSGCIKKRFPYQTNADLRRGINTGTIGFQDMHLSHNAQNIRLGVGGEIDVAIIEAIEVTEEGNIIPSTSVGNSPAFVERAKKVIIELNTAQPYTLKGIHDIYVPKNPPHREPIPIVGTSDRIGTNYIECPKDKIAAIVHSQIKDDQRPLAAVDEVSGRMAQNLLDFFKVEVRAGRLPKDLLPLQSGVGNVANAVLKGIADWDSECLTIYTEVIQDSVFELMDAGKVCFASGTALTPSPQGAAMYYPRLADFSDRLVLRPQEISNHPEVIRRLGVISMNTALEVDIYGHVNSTLACGTKMLNGIGGSGDFARNAYLTIFLCPSTSAAGKISKIVPFCSHIDHTEHDIDVIVTEHGVADLRGMTPRERSREIISKCADSAYSSALEDYRRRAELGKGHEPHLLGEALSWHVRLNETGSMAL